MTSRRGVVAAAVGVLVLAAAAGAVLLSRSSDSAIAAAEQPPSVRLTRGDLLDTRTLTGRIGYAGDRTVAGLGDGLITWLPSAGITVQPGQQLYRVDDAPVVVLVGDMPLYRDLTPPEPPQPPVGAPGRGGREGQQRPPAPEIQHGHDVDLVAANLARLGFWSGGTTDQSYSGYLVAAVRAWQESLGEDPTGVVRRDRVVMANGPVRVLQVLAETATPAAQDVLRITGTRRSITLQAATELAPELAPGDRLQVRLDDGTGLATRVTRIGTAIEDDNGEQVLPVDVRALQPRRLRAASAGPVTARLIVASRHDVVRAPVNALLALSGGGYALELTDHTLVPVRLGLIADGRVEVKGVDAGTRVLVAP